MGKLRLTTAQALVKFLDNQYLEVDGVELKFVKGIFAIFGHGNVLGLGQALEQDSGDMRVYQGRNEQGMAHAATGFARQALRRQIIACTSSIGPGAANMITAAGTASANRIPLLLLPGDVFATRQPDPVLQQIEQSYDLSISTNDAFRAVSKYWDRITRPEQLMSACINAMRVLTDPAETGAVTLCLPQDVQGEAWDYPESFFARRVHRLDRRPASAEETALLQTALDWHNHNWSRRPYTLHRPRSGDSFDYSKEQRAAASPSGDTLSAVWLPGIVAGSGNVQKKALVATR